MMWSERTEESRLTRNAMWRTKWNHGAGPGREPNPAQVAESVAEALTPRLTAALMQRVDLTGVGLDEAVAATEARVKVRVERVVAEAMTRLEEQGIPFSTPESVERVLAAAFRSQCEPHGD